MALGRDALPAERGGSAGLSFGLVIPAMRSPVVLGHAHLLLLEEARGTRRTAYGIVS